MGNCCLYFPPLTAAVIKSSSTLTETLAPVTFPSSILASINASASGCLIDTESIRAPLLPSCATSLVELEYLSMKGTSPVEVRAEFLTGDPLGRICERSCPTPPLLFINCTCSSSIRMMAPYESASPSSPTTKQLEREATWKWFPIPVIGLPAGMMNLK